MAIGLNYTHLEYGGRRLLPNYIFFLNQATNYQFSTKQLNSADRTAIEHLIEHGTLLEELQNYENGRFFDSPLLREMLLESYEYEILYKFCGKDVKNDKTRNQRLIKLFELYFGIDYHREMSLYCTDCERSHLFEAMDEARQHTFSDLHQAVEDYFNFMCALLQERGYTTESNFLRNLEHDRLKISFKEGISGVTYRHGDHVHVDLGNSTYITLYHELTHVIHQLLRRDLGSGNEFQSRDMTKSNEGTANFFAYHLLGLIQSGDVSGVSQVSVDPLYFSAYMDIYATLTEEGSDDASHNRQIIEAELRKFEGELLTHDKIDFYIQRFYKFFHYDQHEFFYPKEMMYYLGYNDVRAKFAACEDKHQFLIDALVGDILAV